uniref:UPF0721 transmembrane protein MJ0441 n=1 Tax=Anthurium amnicola TaxID=1678845 RepID=A0A1D1YRE7_9ARAE
MMSFPTPRWVLLFLPIALCAISHLTTASPPKPTSHPHPLQSLLSYLLQWRVTNQPVPPEREPKLVGRRAAASAALCFVAAAISSAGGVGGGSLFLPILNLVAGMDLKAASSFSAFMVTGGAATNVLYNMCFGDGGLIDYDVALLSQPCMLLGVAAGVVCNVVFPEWLVTLLFAALLAWSTFKTCRAGAQFWKEESETAGRGDQCQLGFAQKRNGAADVGEGEMGMEKPLLGGRGGAARGLPLKKVIVLVIIWLCFFLVQFLRGDKDGKGLIQIRRCGVGYWLITSSQVPLALLFTAYVFYGEGIQQGQHISQEDDLEVPVPQRRTKDLPNIKFPVAALLSGMLGGLFGIGGGLLINPFLLQVGLPPQVTAATSCFMVLFASSMSAFQYLMLGMKGTRQALILAVGCSVASLAGIIIIQRAVEKYGRASLIIFTVSMVMVLSTVSITCFGVIDVLRDYMYGRDMGFKLPC